MSTDQIHSGDDPDGSEFLLIFDDGDFSEDSTFLLTDWYATDASL